jgi:hypothetical protein
MKITLEIPDAIFRRAKTVAAERGIPFRVLSEYRYGIQQSRDRQR